MIQEEAGSPTRWCWPPGQDALRPTGRPDPLLPEVDLGLGEPSITENASRTSSRGTSRLPPTSTAPTRSMARCRRSTPISTDSHRPRSPGEETRCSGTPSGPSCAGWRMPMWRCTPTRCPGCSTSSRSSCPGPTRVRPSTNTSVDSSTSSWRTPRCMDPGVLAGLQDRRRPASVPVPPWGWPHWSSPGAGIDRGLVDVDVDVDDHDLDDHDRTVGRGHVCVPTPAGRRPRVPGCRRPSCPPGRVATLCKYSGVDESGNAIVLQRSRVMLGSRPHHTGGPPRLAEVAGGDPADRVQLSPVERSPSSSSSSIRPARG